MGRSPSPQLPARLPAEPSPACLYPLLRTPCSPGRIGRLLRVVRAALPAGEDEAGGGGAVSGDGPAAGVGGLEPWRQHAEYEGGLRVLTWSGLGYTTAAWCPRYGVLYQVGGSARSARQARVGWEGQRSLPGMNTSEGGGLKWEQGGMEVAAPVPGRSLLEGRGWDRSVGEVGR